MRGLVEAADLQDEVGNGQVVIAGRRLDCSYSVTFVQKGRKRQYEHISGTVIKTNREWQELQRHGLNLSSGDGWAADLHLADGKIAHGYLRVKGLAAGAPGRSVFRFALLAQGPSEPAA